MPKCIALVTAAGRGRRFGDGLPKQYRTLAGKPVLWRAISALLASPRIDAVRVVIHPDDAELYADCVGGLALMAPVFGGETRQESVLNGLESLADDPPALVLVHDGARPFVSASLVARVADALDGADGAIPALPVVDTLKRGRGDGLDVAGTVERAALWRAQTPQGFHFAPLLAAHRASRGHSLTDDAAVAEAAGMRVRIVQGEEENLKITTEDDMRRSASHLLAETETRVATGFDVHRLAEGCKLILCGVPIEHDRGLLGHSDADVGLHALTDALLGTIAAGDIGQHFPPSEARWRGADSTVFVRHAAEMVAAAGGRIVNVDVTLVCERPKIARYRDAMRERLAAMLSIGVDRVSVKATTTEQLGFTGRGEGIAATAVASVRLPCPPEGVS